VSQEWTGEEGGEKSPTAREPPARPPPRPVPPPTLLTTDYKRTAAATAAASEADQAAALAAAHARGAARVRDLCHANGGVYVKLGQHVATLVRAGEEKVCRALARARRADPPPSPSAPPFPRQDHLLPSEYVSEMRATMLNACPPSPYADVAATVEAELGAPITSLFASFDRAPVASASLAQVHRAVTVGGDAVAVKVQHRGLREACAADVATVAALVAAARLAFPSFDLSWLVAEVKANLPAELDFRREAANAARCSANLARGASRVAGRVSVPRPHPALPPTPRVHVMEWVDGVPVNDGAGLDAAGVNRADAAALVARAFAEMTFRHGFVHADPHAGNLLVRRGGDGRAELVLLDHGLYRE